MKNFLNATGRPPRVPSPFRLISNGAKALGNWLREDWKWKVASLFLALVIYYIIQSVFQGTRIIRVPVEARAFAGPQSIYSISPSEVRVELRGLKDRVRRIDKDTLCLRVGKRPRNDTLGEIDVRLRRGMLESTDGMRQALPQGVRIVSFDPEIITLDFDKEDEHVFSIELPILENTPMLGVASVTFAGDSTVRVKGPSRILSPLVENGIRFPTSPIDVSSWSSSGETTVMIIPPKELRSLMSEEDLAVRVKVTINETTDTRTITDVPVLLASAPHDDLVFSCEPASVDVQITGGQTLVKKLLNKNVTAIVYCDDIAPDAAAESVLPVKVWLSREFIDLKADALTNVTVRCRAVPLPEPAPDVLFLPPAEGDGVAGPQPPETVPDTAAGGEVAPEPAPEPAVP